MGDGDDAAERDQQPQNPKSEISQQRPSYIELASAGIIITSELASRETRAQSSEIVMTTLRRLEQRIETAPTEALQACVELALELCSADTCVISLCERTDAGEDVFRLVASAGQLKQHLLGTMPRYFSPCGICLDNKAPVLMRRPELVYKYLDVGPPFHDVLLIPLVGRNRAFEGTIWVVAHSLAARKFDMEDVRLMQCISIYIASVLNARPVGDPELSESECLRRVAELSPRERQVLIAIASGRSNREIAADLGLSVRTVEAHRNRMMERLGVAQLALAVRLAVAAKIV